MKKERKSKRKSKRFGGEEKQKKCANLRNVCMNLNFSIALSISFAHAAAPTRTRFDLFVFLSSPKIGSACYEYKILYYLFLC